MCAEAEPAPGGGHGDGEVRQRSCAQKVREAERVPRCPTCRVILAKNVVRAIRALSAEQSIAALPSLCRYCKTNVPRDGLQSHEAACPRAPELCAAGGDGGCRWTGPRGERDAHEATCVRGRARELPLRFGCRRM